MAENKMTWTNCYSDKRFGIDDPTKGSRSQFERDWDRIIFSSPFRRLQNKTQVFPLPGEVFVHNRLTHSLEVASVGRSLGKIVGKHISELPEIVENADPRRFYRNQLKNVIAAACLAHDLGNPAFGHSGEDAISKFFKDKEVSTPENDQFRARFTPQQWKDLTNFEGNANALRVLTLQVKGRLKGGFRLTYSTLGSILKYPCESSVGFDKKHLHRKKYGFFHADKSIFTSVVQELNMVKDVSCAAGISYMRHPFVFLVEAADDICYNIIDFEDAHRLGILPFSVVRKHFMELIQKNEEEDMANVKKNLRLMRDDNNEALAYLRAKAINCLAVKASRVFLRNSQSILEGTYNKALLEDIPEIKKTWDSIVKQSYANIYNYREVVKIELAGFRIMSGLIEDFVEAALTPERNRVKRHKKVLLLLPPQFQLVESESDYMKVLHIIDYISGMTDLFALKLYKNLRGIEIPHLN